MDSVNTASKLLACPKSGCVLTPRQVVAMQWDINSVVWLANGTVVFQGAPTQSTIRPALFPCLDTGCVGTPTSVASDGLGGFLPKLVTVGNRVFYSSQNLALNNLTCTAGACTNGTTLGVGKSRPFTTDGSVTYYVNSGSATTLTGYILSCDLSVTGTCTPATVLATDVSSAADIQLVGSTLYWLLPGRDGYNDGRIRKCTVPGCATVTDLASSLNSPVKEMLVESTGAYVVNASNVIQRCVGATCTGGAQDWVTTATAPQMLRSDASFVYWVDGTKVQRVAK
jgi:hypothetical protein